MLRDVDDSALIAAEALTVRLGGNVIVDHVDLVVFQRRLDAVRVTNVAFDKPELLGRLARRQPGTLNGRIVERVKTVQRDHVAPTLQKRFAQVRADEAGAAGH